MRTDKTADDIAPQRFRKEPEYQGCVKTGNRPKAFDFYKELKNQKYNQKSKSNTAATNRTDAQLHNIADSKGYILNA